jgi:hypothetical protein
VLGIFGGVGRGRLREQLLNLRQRLVRLLRRIASQLRPIQAEHAQAHHALGRQQPQHLRKQATQRLLMPRPEPGDRRMIGAQPAGDHPVAHIAHAPLSITRLDRSPWQCPYSNSATIISGAGRRPPMPIGTVPGIERAQLQGGHSS